LQNGEEGIRVLTWKQVDQIVARFEALNPYDRSVIAGSMLKIEDDNRDPKTGNRRQLYCLAISAKRYALFLMSENKKPVLLREETNNKKDRWSRHGLGHLLNPTDPEASDQRLINANRTCKVLLHISGNATYVCHEHEKEKC
jgi:hypothetical protein